jgi:hypothetical protein
MFVSERLQEYREHWVTVDWERSAGVVPVEECPPEMRVRTRSDI